MFDKLFIRKLCKNKLDCLNEISFWVNLISRMPIYNFLFFFAWINLDRWIWIFVLNFSCDLARLHVHRVIRHHPAKCGGISFVKEEVLSFQFGTWLLVITWSCFCNFVMGFASPYASTLQSLVAISLLEEEIFHFWFVTRPYVTRWSEGHVTWWICLSHHKSSTFQVSWP